MRLQILIAAVVAAVATTGTLAASGLASRHADRRACSISGRVTLNGRPAPGVIVALGRGMRNRPGANAVADDDGRYTLRDVPPGTHYILPDVPGYSIKGDLEYTAVTVEEGEAIQGIDFELVRAGVIMGRVLDADGSPIAGAILALQKMTAYNRLVPNRVERSTSTGPDGGYQFVDVQAGPYRLAAITLRSAVGETGPRKEYFYPGAASAADAGTLVVVPGGELTGIDIRYGAPPRGFTASGRVVDAQTGAPLADVRLVSASIAKAPGVTSSSTDARTGADGRFTLVGLKPGENCVGLFHMESGIYYAPYVFFRISDQNADGLVIEARRGSTLRGQVLFDRAEAGPEAVDPTRWTVGFNLPSDQPFNGYKAKQVQLDAGGRFELRGVPPGPNRLYLLPRLRSTAPQFVVQIRRDGVLQRDGTVTVDGDVSNLRILATAEAGTGAIRGYVRPASGSLARLSLDVMVVRRDDSSTHLSRTIALNPDGRFVAESLPAGEYDVMVVKNQPDGTSRRTGDVQRVQVPAGGTATVEMVIPGG